METIFHGHSFIEICTDEMCIFIDPFIEGNTHCDITVEQCIEKKPTAIIVTHGHDDHIWSTVKIAKDTWCQVITSYELGRYFQEIHDCKNVSSHGVWWWVAYEWFHVKLFQAWHWWWVSSCSEWFTTVACGVIVTVWDRVIYHAWDTWLFGDMKMLNEQYDIDVAFLPIGDRYTMGVEDAIIATDRIRPKYAVPIHYNTRDPITADDMTFAREVMLGNYAVPKVLRPGQGIVLS